MICIHYWSVESPNGPESKAVCKKCQEVKYFRNAFEEIRKKRNGKMVADLSVNAKNQARYTQRELNNAD